MMDDFSRLVGMTIDAALDEADRAGLKLNLTRVNGIYTAPLKYEDLNRLNIEVANDRVTRVVGLG